MSDSRAWSKRPKWRHLESVQSYARRQCSAAGVPFDYVERGLTSRAQPYIYRVWADESLAARTVEAAAGRPEGHYERLRRIAQPVPDHVYPARFLCRLCAGGERIEQIRHDRENWCLRHPGQMVWVGPGTVPETQAVLPFEDQLAKSERSFRRLVTAGRVDPRLHARVWEMIRDSAQLSKSLVLDEPETHGRALLYGETVATLTLLSDPVIVDRWRTQSASELRSEIARTLPSMRGGIDVLVERIVLWLRPKRRANRLTRIDPLDVPLDLVDAPSILDASAPYPQWIQLNPHAIAEWDWERNESARDPWDAVGVSKKAAWICDEGHSWEVSPFTRGNAMTRCPYCVGQRVWPGHTDLGSTHPSVASEWDTTTGDNVGDPGHVGASSGRRINWLCRNGHRWNAPIRNRTKLGFDCPYCAGTRPIPGETDLSTVCPDIATDWDYKRNGDLTPLLVRPGSSKKVWWAAHCGHRWRAVVSDRTRENGTSCPYCANKSVLVGFNDLDTTHPHLATQWNASNSKTASAVTAGSEYPAQWTCDVGHTWSATIYSRARLDTGCPFCANRAVLPGYNDLNTLNPELAAQWDASPGANSRGPSELTIGTTYRAHWLCPAGHSWSATVASRSAGSGCPYCSGRLAIRGETDLVTLRPSLAAEWDDDNDVSADEVSYSSNRTVAWRCQRGHRWRAVIANRSKGHGCPYCAGQRPFLGETDLATLRPDLAAEWDPSNTLSPSQVTRFSNRNVTWRCAREHTWRAIVANRSQGSGCPYCAGKRVIPGETDLATLRPHLVTQWDDTNDFTPDQVACFSKRKVTWCCAQGHTWRAAIVNRSNGTGCPQCYAARRKSA